MVKNFRWIFVGIQQAGSQSCGTAFATDDSTLHFLYSIDKLLVIPVIQQCRNCNFSPNLLDITENDVVQIEIYIGNSYDRRDNIYEPGGMPKPKLKNEIPRLYDAAEDSFIEA